MTDAERDGLHALQASIAAENLEAAEGFVVATIDPIDGELTVYGPFDDPISAIEFGDEWCDDLQLLDPRLPKLTYQVLILHDTDGN